MKLLCLLFALFVLIFSERPCCAESDCDENKINQQQHAQHPVNEKECPGCSPFFSCGSCVGFIVAKPAFFSIESTFETSERTTCMPYVYPGLKEVSLAVWQPPQKS